MAVSSHLFITIACVTIFCFGFASSTSCKNTIPQDIEICTHKDEEEYMVCPTHVAEECLNGTTSTLLETFAITEVATTLLNVTMAFCCDRCKTIKVEKHFLSAVNMYYDITYGNDKSSFIYPILGTKSTKRLHGRYFIPLIDVDNMVLVTRKINETIMVDALIDSCFLLAPLLCICILMALASGFIIWFLDTWSNEEQFPRHFMHGIYEGFWWAFISMTTVGYGDKTPVSLCARVFGIFWIIIGITIFSMLTASLTDTITSVGELPSVHITGKNIIVLKHRLHDASYVLKNGGIIYKELTSEECHGVLQTDLMIHGLVTDHISVAYFRKVFPEMASNYDFQNMPADTEQHSYGILVNDEKLYNYLQPFFEDHTLLYESCNLLLMSTNKTTGPYKGPFHPKNGAFWMSVVGISVICVIFALIGMVIEYFRRRNLKTKAEIPKRTEDDVIKGMQTLIQELAEIRKEKQLKV